MISLLLPALLLIGGSCIVVAIIASFAEGRP